MHAAAGKCLKCKTPLLEGDKLIPGLCNRCAFSIWKKRKKDLEKMAEKQR